MLLIETYGFRSLSAREHNSSQSYAVVCERENTFFFASSVPLSICPGGLNPVGSFLLPFLLVGDV